MQPAKHLANLPSSYIREILAAATSENCISLAGGLPCANHFPLTHLASTIQTLDQDTALFQYGTTKGYEPLRQHLLERYNVSAEHDLIVTNGSQQGIDLIARVFLDQGDEIVMEAPSYLGAIQAFALSQATIKTVPQTPVGPDLDILESLFSSGNIKFFYAVPDFHNPTGVCWSLETRQRVGELCHKYHVALIEDAPYRDIRFHGEALPLASSFCPDNALTLTSFSKTAMPGLRLGCVRGPSQWISLLERVKQATDLHTNLPLQHLLLQLLTHPAYPAHLTTLIDVYGSRYRALTDELSSQLGEWGRFNAVDGGMFVWFELNQFNADQLAKSALENGVAVVPASVFYSGEANAPAALRLNYSHSTLERLKEAVSRLANVFKLVKVAA